MTCEVYLLDVSSLSVSESLLQRLSPERQAKVRAYRHEGGQKLSLGAGLLLDSALRRYGLCERKAQYSYGHHGKPHIGGLHFNLSHSGSMAACAIAPHPVGIDLERTQRRISEALLKRVCSTREQEMVSIEPIAFFDLWTAKEAVLKMTGEGINGDLTAIDLKGVATWRLPEGYALSVCTSHPMPVNIYRFSGLQALDNQLPSGFTASKNAESSQTKVSGFSGCAGS